MTHPLLRLSAPSRGRLLKWTAGGAVAVWLASVAMGGPLLTDAAPWGIVSFELARTLQAAQGMMDSWGEAGRLWAAFGLGWDYLFLLTYSVAIALGCLRVADRGLGLWLAWGQAGAALLDAVENAALLRLLLGDGADWDAGLAFWCATIKFMLVGFGLAYIAGGLIVRRR